MYSETRCFSSLHCKSWIALPETLKPGVYTLSLKLFSTQSHRTVFLAISPELKDEHNFYRICTVEVVS